MTEKNGAYRMLFLITTPKLTEKATQVLSAQGVPVEFRLSAVGTATSEIMDVLGLGSIDKTILCCTLPRPLCADVLASLSEALKFGSANSGIAFTLPLAGMSNLMLQLLAQMDPKQTEERKEDTAMNRYSLIAAMINRGYSNELMDAAREAGASGGSVLHSRQILSEDIKWDLGAQEEKEIVLIVAKAEAKADIMKKITEKCGVHSQAQGLVFALPIEEAAGLPA